ncbi:Uncharacterised protein [Aggregatibacter aphrophilus]|uniref:Uncharacterized protein n=1 Tax=Aggregatibacter aphrophilus TaxID=732 RepID=A0A336N8F4_AGGAP|nr:Uncharacterised protein [Aggregatibacter aphrophilus]
MLKVGGALVLLYKYDYRETWTAGDDLINKYDDNDIPGGKYLMLSSNAEPKSNIYKDYAIPAGKYARFVLDYKIMTYNQRRGKCRVIVQLLNGKNVVQSYDSDLMGDWQTNEWHPQQVADKLPAGVNIIRFKIVPEADIRNNALTFRDITIRVGEE